MRRILIVLAALVVLLVVAVLVVPSLIDWNQYKSDITAEVEAQTGRRLAIEGDLDLTILPSPALSAAGLRLSNAEDAHVPDMVKIETLKVEIAFWPLLGGEVKVDLVRLIGPTVALEIMPNGRGNWLLDSSDSPALAGEREGTGAVDEILPFRLDRLEIEGGAVTLLDASGVTRGIESLDALLTAESLDGPLAVVGTFGAEGVQASFDISAGALTESTIQIKAELGLGVGESLGRVSYGGTAVRVGLGAPAASGKLQVTAPSMAKLAEGIAQALGAPAVVPAMLDQPLALDAKIEVTAEEGTLNEIALTLGGSRATGAVSAAFAEGVQVDLALLIKRINLNEWLALSDTAGPPLEAADTSAPSEPADALALPSDLSGSFNVEVEALTYNDALVRQATISGAIIDGTVEFGRIAALLPGGSDVTMSGTLATVEGQPRFEGQLEAASDNLRVLLAWLEVEPNAVPADRLRKLGLTTNMRLTPALMQAYRVDLRLDASRMTGGIAYAVRERTAFSVDLDIDRLNLDAYLPAESLVGEGGDTPEPGVAQTQTESSLAMLETIDTNVTLRVGELTYNRIRVKGLSLDSSLVGGVLTITDARIGDVAGAALNVVGSASGFAAAPKFAGSMEIIAADPGGLIQLAGLAWPMPSDRLGPFNLRGDVKRGADGLLVDLSGTAAGTSLTLTGAVASLALDAPLKLRFELANPRLADLVAQIDEVEVGPCGNMPAELVVDLDGALVGDLAVAVTATAAGGWMAAAGAVQALAGVGYDLKIKVKHPDMTGLINDLGIDYRPAATNLGGLTVETSINGDLDEADLRSLNVRAGPMAVEGNATVRLGGARPWVKADLRASQILVDLFLPVERSESTSVGSGSADGAERWSRAPIDLGALSAMDGEIDLAAVAIDYGDYHFTEPSLHLGLDSGVLTIDPLVGGLYGGSVKLRARIADAETPTIDLTFAVESANILEALRANAGIDRVTGRFAASGDMASQGRSQYELVSSLNGDMRFAARDGVFRGIDLRSLSDRMKELDRTTDFLQLVQISTSDGETSYTVLDGTVRITDGVGRTNDLRALMDAAEGRGAGEINLPRWLLDLQTKMRLSEHPNAPPLGLNLKGPIDALRRDVKLRELEAYIAQRVGTTVLRKLAPDALTDFLPETGASNGASEPDAGAGSPQEKVGKTLKKLLDAFGD
jgi:uncharacterized protein involved in outer membrane biogenesis